MNFDFKCKLLDDEKQLKASQVMLFYTKMFISEVVATFILIFCGCILVTLPLLHIAFGFGFLIAGIVQIFGAISLSQINPSVAVSFFIFGIYSLPMMLISIIAECVGATAGSFLLEKMILHKTLLHPSYCCTVPAQGLSLTAAFMWEFGATSFVILIICSLVDPRNIDKHESISFKIGLLFVVLVYAVVGLTGASMNPARSLGPAIVYNVWDYHWLYWVAPLSGSAVTSILYHIFFLPKKNQEMFHDKWNEAIQAYKK